MTERLSDVETRIRAVDQLSAVITAMRGIAAARVREARGRVQGIHTYTKTIATAIGHALAFLSAAERNHTGHRETGTHAIVALCAEQGFADAFSEHVLDAAEALRKRNARQPTELLIVGDRGLMAAEQRALSIDWSAAMIAHPDQAAKLANLIVDALYKKLDTEHVVRVTLLHAVPDTSTALQIVERQLVPFDFTRFPLPTGAREPLITLAPQVLLARLVEEYVFAEICEAVMLSFAAENEARMRAMIAAHTNVSKTMDGLRARSRQLRQEEITNEIVELAGGAAESSGSKRVGLSRTRSQSY